MQIKIIDHITGEDPECSNEKIASFLYKYLEQYGDKKEDIFSALQYSLNPNKGGFIVIAQDDDKNILGTVVILKTGMSGYIPENILVYIATHSESRGQGLGKKLMKETIKKCEGNIALHVEKNNPARFLYEKFGFTTPYLEMRLIRNKT